MMEKLCVFGEVLFDVFPEGQRVLGGAPFNVAWHLHAFGLNNSFISRVGDDSDGEHIRKVMHDRQMSTSTLQIDQTFPTGLVTIELIKDEPHYDIVFPSAYDYIEPVSGNDAIDFLYHGSLALRHEQSEKTLVSLLDKKPKTVFIDVNIRDPWWQKGKVLHWLKQANWVKLNTDELELLYPSKKTTQQQLTDFISAFKLDGVILTQGKSGAGILTSEGQYFSASPDADVRIVDTVGAGDAFSSIIIMGLIRKWPMSQTIQKAQQFSSAIVQQRGATVSNKQFYTDFLNNWQES